MQLSGSHVANQMSLGCLAQWLCLHFGNVLVSYNSAGMTGQFLFCFLWEESGFKLQVDLDLARYWTAVGDEVQILV